MDGRVRSFFHKRALGGRARRAVGLLSDRSLLHLATNAAVGVAVALIAIKLFAWTRTNSVSMLSSLVDSLLDAVASGVNLLAVRHALQPADREHRFGHGKAESIASLVQAAVIAGSAVFLLFQATARLFQPTAVDNSLQGIVIMVISIALTSVLVALQRYAVRRTGSLAVHADSFHYTSDILTNLSVIVALLLAADLGWDAADPLFAIGIALYIFYGAWQILTRAYDHLMDREFPDDVRARIRAIVLANPKVMAMHDLRTRSSGVTSFIQMHIEMDGSMSLADAHRITDEVESALLAAFPGTEIIIHEDPAGIDEPRPNFPRT